MWVTAAGGLSPQTLPPQPPNPKPSDLPTTQLLPPSHPPTHLLSGLEVGLHRLAHQLLHAAGLADAVSAQLDEADVELGGLRPVLVVGHADAHLRSHSTGSMMP